MRLNFTKMHGAGNDFVMIDLITQRCNLRRRHIRTLADRHFGVGCDQVLVAEPPRRPDVDFRYRIFNADGSEAEQCGNGARCFARFVRERKLTGKRRIRVESRGGLLELNVLTRERVEVTLCPPRFEPAEIPFEAPTRAPSYRVTSGEEVLDMGVLSMGNPHAVLRVEDCDAADVGRLGPAVQALEAFPKGVNVGFMQVISPTEVRLRVYERGAGETLACGSGACAAVVYGLSRGWLAGETRVHLPGGELEIRWRGEGEPVIMTGPATVVFEGSIRI